MGNMAGPQQGPQAIAQALMRHAGQNGYPGQQPMQQPMQPMQGPTGGVMGGAQRAMQSGKYSQPQQPQMGIQPVTRQVSPPQQIMQMLSSGEGASGADPAAAASESGQPGAQQAPLPVA